MGRLRLGPAAELLVDGKQLQLRELRVVFGRDLRVARAVVPVGGDVLAVVAVVLLTGVPATSARADGIAVQANDAKSSFPAGIVMTLTASSNVKITSTRLKFTILPDNPTTQGKVECTGDAVVNCKSTIGGPGGAYVVPFAEVRYTWEITDSAGQTMTTPEKSVTYDDSRFKWMSVTDGNVTAYSYVSLAKF